MLHCATNRTSFIRAKQVRAALKKAKIGPNKTYSFPKAGTRASHGRAAWVLRGSVLGWVQRRWPGGRTRLGQGHPPARPQPSSALSPLTVKRGGWLLVTVKLVVLSLTVTSLQTTPNSQMQKQPTGYEKSLFGSKQLVQRKSKNK